MNQTFAKIYPSDLRGAVNTNSFKCLSIFNFGNYQEVSRVPFGDLLVFNDETLAGGSAFSHRLSQDALVLILPIAGAVDVEFNSRKEFVHINQLQVFGLKKESTFSISNPYETEVVNYLHMQFKNDTDIKFLQNEFDLSQKNNLQPIFTTKNIKINIGIFDGRRDGIYVLKDSKSKLFTHIIRGAFEFQNRLLEFGDSLYQSEIIQAEFEALSENALLLIIEEFNS